MSAETCHYRVVEGDKMSQETSTRTAWDAADFMGFGTIIAVGGWALFAFLAALLGVGYLLFAGWFCAVVGGLVLQIGVIAKAVQVGMTGMTLD